MKNHAANPKTTISTHQHLGTSNIPASLNHIRIIRGIRFIRIAVFSIITIKLSDVQLIPILDIKYVFFSQFPSKFQMNEL